MLFEVHLENWVPSRVLKQDTVMLDRHRTARFVPAPHDKSQPDLVVLKLRVVEQREARRLDGGEFPIFSKGLQGLG